MGSDSSGSNEVPETPAWLRRIDPRGVGARCWNWARLESRRYGVIPSLASYLPAAVLACLAVVAATVLYSIGYVLARPTMATGREE